MKLIRKLIILLTVWLTESKDLTCHLSACPDIRKGNHKCDPGCMTSYCNFDTLLSIDGKINKESSDCYKSCANIDGCDPNDLGNGECDSSCNTEHCGFDWGDCTCAPGCLDSMLGDGKCDKACDNWDCDLDNHDCGHCADGCFPNMLGNGVCDPECNKEECLYDYKDCQCAEGCLFTDYGTCKPECMVTNCDFDRIPQYPNSWCQNTSLAIFSSYQQIVRQNFSYIASLEDCYKVSSYKCTFDMVFDFENCHEECYILECNYANGRCNSSIYEAFCNGIYLESQHYLCLSCTTSNWLGYTYTLMNRRCLPYTFIPSSPSIFPDNSFVYVPIIDKSSEKIPHIYFICPDKNANPNSGTGNYFSPFKSLSYAMNRIGYKYSIIYLLECDDYYLTNYLYVTSKNYVMVSENFTFSGKYVIFAPFNSSIITIQRVFDDKDMKNRFGFSFDFVNPQYIEMKNIIFDWKNTASSCASEKYCDYCPYTTFDSRLGVYYSDQGEVLDNFLPKSWCLRDKSQYFIGLQSGNMVLKNVSFVNFRTGFKNILYIKNDSNVTLIDATFDNIIIYHDYDSWVIWWSGTGYGNFKFENGIVRRLNNGYELFDPIDTKGFMNAGNINSIVFRNVEFRNNAVYKQSTDGMNIASLMFMNLFQSLLIDSCAFLYNYCDLGIIHILQQFNKFSTEIDDDEVIIYSKNNHIHIFNSTFMSNYWKNGGALYALFENETQNILIENSSFDLNGIESQPLIHIESNYADKNYIINRKVNITSHDGRLSEGNYLAKWVKFYNLNFTKNYWGNNGIFEIIKMVNIEWKNINISSNGLIFSEAININSILLKYYIDNPILYPILNFTNPVDLNCLKLSMVSDSINFSVDNINVNNNFCKYSSPSIDVFNTTNSTMKFSSFYDNKGSGEYGICLAIFGDKPFQVLNSEFYSNINYQPGNPGVISSLSSLSIQNCTFSNNIGTLHFEGQNLTIISSRFDSNSSPLSYGGAISLLISQESIYNSILFIKNTTFENNSCSFSGGAIYIKKAIPLELLLAVTIDDIYFYNNQALEGSCIYIDNSLALTLYSSISSCSFRENKASFSGTISASYTSGKLIFDNCNFLKNSGIYSSVFIIAIGENNERNNSKIILNSCIFQFNSGNVTVSLENANINSTLEAYNCLLEYNIGTIFSLDNDYTMIKHSRIQHNFSPISGGALNLKTSAIFWSENTIYLNCSSYIGGGVASISLKSQFFCFSCIFTYNYAGSSGGAIYADSDAQFYLHNSIINKNSCKNKGSAVFIASSLVSSLINNTEIYENHAYSDGTIFILSSLFSIFSSKIYRNEADEKNPGIYLDDSNIIITNISFSDQSGNQGCFIYMSTSYMNITNSTFNRGFSNYSGTAIHATSSNVQIYSSAFSDLSSNDTGGSIYLYEDSSLSIKGSTFFNSDSSIDSYSSSIFIENTLFKNHSNSAIYASQIKTLQILSSDFFDSYSNNGGALYCAQCNIISIISSSFTRNSGENGGAIYVKNEADYPEIAKVTIVSSNFQSNAASNGGAIWTNNINVEISSSIFIENKAESLITNSLNEIINGIGGALKINCKDSNIICDFEILSNSFISNTATYNGGAISWDYSKPNFENNIFQNNSAQYGPDISSFPVMMMFLGNDSRKLQSRSASEYSNLTLNDVASGQENNPSLAFALVDDLYQIVTTDTVSQAQISAISDDTIISGSTVVYAKNGIYYFSDYIISAKPGSSVYINIVSSAIDTQKINTSSSFSISVNLRVCEIGEATVGLICETCPEFYYNIDAKIPNSFLVIL